MAEIANIEMAKAWDGDEGAHFAQHADRYDRVSSVNAARLLEAAALEPGLDMIDIGCGAGRLAVDCAEVIAPGTVLGIDLSNALLAVANRRAQDGSLHNARFERGDAQVHPFDPESAALAISSFGAMFFADPVAAFRNIGRALRPSGRLVMLTWQDLESNEWLSEIRSALAVGRALPTPPAGVPGPFGLAEPSHIESVLDAAGYAAIDIGAVDGPLNFGDDPDDAFGFVSTLGITRGLTQDLEEGARRDALDALREVMARYATADGVQLGSAAWLVSAHLDGRR